MLLGVRTKRFKMEWTDKMYQFLAWKILLDAYETTGQAEKEERKIKLFAEKTSENISVIEKKFVEHQARQIKNDYYELLLGTLERMYQGELRDEDHEEWHIAAPVEFNENFLEIWMQAVKKRITVQMIYNSTTSGESERLVDPYLTRTPYGKGYCHTRKEIRKFRFDRIVDIKLTGKNFEKRKIDEYS